MCDERSDGDLPLFGLKKFFLELLRHRRKLQQRWKSIRKATSGAGSRVESKAMSARPKKEDMQNYGLI